MTSKIQYGTVRDDGAAGTVHEHASMDAAREYARECASSGVACDVVELEGVGPCYASDGEQISTTHAPRKTLETHEPRHACTPSCPTCKIG